MNVQAGDRVGQPPEAGREKAAARSDFQYAVGRFRQQRLQHATLERRRHHGLTEPERDLLDVLARITRGLCLVGVFGLLIASAGLAVSVFVQIGALIKQPEQAKDSVAAIAELISADSLSLVYADDQSLQFGNLVAFLLYNFLPDGQTA